MAMIDPITRTLQQGVEAQVFPGAVLFVRSQGQIKYHHAVGLASHIPHERPTHVNTCYDLASLTKPLATGTGVLCLIQDGLLHLDQEIVTLLPELQSKPIARATIRDLLCHRSGLPGYRPYYQDVVLQQGQIPGEQEIEVCRSDFFGCIAQEPLEYAPRTKSVYSDLGFILLGFAIESVIGKTFSQYCADRIFTQLRAHPLSYLKSSNECQSVSSDIAPTEQDPWRGRLIEGEVHDENAYVLGGVAGHAGLFGTAEAVSVITKAWLDAYHGRDSLLDSQLVREFVTKQKEPNESSWALGWDTPSERSSSGQYFSTSSFGHLGFTGTSIWIDPEVELEVILLSNRVHPTRGNNKIREFRPKIHNVVYQEVIAPSVN